MHTPSLNRGLSLKARLYFIILLLGALPVAGAVISLLALQKGWNNHSDLDRATRGAVQLERINSLVYAIVMESRGIYMSADWIAAAPFAKRMLTGLDEIQGVSVSWQKAALSSQRESALDLTRRLTQFIEFRRELVRLAREETTAAARLYGDNDSNRSVRTALNDSLSMLARVYEAEIASARDRVRSDDQRLRVARLSLAGVAVLGSGY